MNTLQGVISYIHETTHMSYVKINLDEDNSIKTIILETSGTLSYLKSNRKIKVLFKETEVILSRLTLDGTSLENSLNGVIKKIDPGEILTRVELDTAFGKLASIVTTASFQKLNVKVEDSIVASVNSSEIMLAE